MWGRNKHERAGSYVCILKNKSTIPTEFAPYPMKDPGNWEQIQSFSHRKYRNTADQIAWF